MFNAIEIDRTNLTIMGVKFSDLKTLESTANALGSNMFEGFKPTPKGVEIIRDYVTGKISMSELISDVITLTELIYELIISNK
ncbi:MAG TPA: antitoxin VbhA family protein [Marinilabiliaceae bacterium]|nr:antitoxin VbhA family protein [Marinilabiliaceae bacterium]